MLARVIRLRKGEQASPTHCSHTHADQQLRVLGHSIDCHSTRLLDSPGRSSHRLRTRLGGRYCSSPCVRSVDVCKASRLRSNILVIVVGIATILVVTSFVVLVVIVISLAILIIALAVLIVAVIVMLAALGVTALRMGRHVEELLYATHGTRVVSQIVLVLYSKSKQPLHCVAAAGGHMKRRREQNVFWASSLPHNWIITRGNKRRRVIIIGGR